MANKIPDSLIDDILESTREYSEEDIPVFSSSDIDELIASLGVTDAKEDVSLKQETDKNPDISEMKAEKKEETVPNAEKTVTVETNDSVKDGLQPVEKTPEAPAIKSPEIPKKSQKKQSDFLRFIKKSNVLADNGSVYTTADVSLSEDEDGQIGLTANGEEISIPKAFEEDAEPEDKKETLSVGGQISIEKTRMFNEVKVHGEYNPNISHNLGNKVTRTTTGEGEAVSTPVMGEEKYRKHFMNRPVQILEKTQEHRDLLNLKPEKTRETPGIIVKKNNYAVFENTDGFEAIPTIVPASLEAQNEISSSTEDVPEWQIKLDGFGDEAEVEKTTEEEAEAQLLEARKEAVKEFVDKGLIFKQELDSEKEDNLPENRKKRYARKKVRITREFFGPKDTNAVLAEYYKEKRKITLRLVTLSIICAVMMIMSAVVGAGSGDFSILGGEAFGYIALELILLFVACAVSFGSFRRLFKDISNIKPNLDLVVVISAVVGILQTAAAFGFTDEVESGVHLFSAAAVIPMIFKTVGELIDCLNDLDNFCVISDEKTDYYTVENIADEDSAAEIARGLMLGEPEIKYSARTHFPRRFVEISREADVTPSILKYSLLGITAVSLIIGVVTFAIEKNILLGLTSFAGAFLMGVPAAAGIISASSLSHANKKLRENESVINGYAAVENAVNSNGVIIDSADAFKSGGCNIEGIKLYHKMRIDEALLYTASVVIASGGVLSDVFEGVIVGKNELLLPVETLAYEEKLGCSCWIHNHRVLVGNRELLRHHNVELPDDGLEEKFRESGKNTLYLAIEGKISAMFIVSYKADEMTAHYVRALERDGVAILFRTSDANITESFLEQEFGLPKNVVKIINPVAGEMFTSIKNETSEQSDAYIVHDGSVLSMLKAIHLSFGISQFINISRIVETVASVIGVLLIASLSFMSGLGQVSSWQIIIYQIVWGAILYFLPAFKKTKKG